MINASRNPEISILPARLDDLDAIMIMERSGFPTAEQWSERTWRGELLGEHRTILIARAHHLVGVISISTIGELADLPRLQVVTVNIGLPAIADGAEEHIFSIG